MNSGQPSLSPAASRENINLLRGTPSWNFRISWTGVSKNRGNPKPAVSRYRMAYSAWFWGKLGVPFWEIPFVSSWNSRLWQWVLLVLMLWFSLCTSKRLPHPNMKTDESRGPSSASASMKQVQIWCRVVEVQTLIRSCSLSETFYDFLKAYIIKML